MTTTNVGVRFRKIAESDPERRAFTLLVDGETQEVNLTIGQLDRQARQIGAALQKLSLQGERVLLIFPFGLEFNAAILGCAYAGAVAVLSYPPRPDRPLKPLQDTAENAGAKAVLITQGMLDGLRGQLEAYPVLNALQWLPVEPIFAEQDPAAWLDPHLPDDAPMLLSYTSGSTNAPSGVLLNQRNVLACVEVLKERLELSENVIGVVSNPMYHIGGALIVLGPLISSASLVLISTQLVLERPVRWLQAISRYRASITGGFNFLFQLSLQRISPAERDALDLSCVEHMSVGGERVDAHLLERFMDYFAPSGLKHGVVQVSYGLTETAAMVSISKGLQHHAFQYAALQQRKAVIAEGDEGQSVELSSCGQAILGDVCIVDPDTHARCADQQVGEIWARGPQVADGYWKDPEKTRATFEAYLDTGEGPYLRTGDLGFLYEGELYISGRMKDIIILRGRNFSSPDFEQAVARAHPAILAGGTAALGVMIAGEEQLVMIQEIANGTAPADYDTVIGAIRAKITAEFEQPIYAVALVAQDKLPRTISRKIQRYRCLDDFQSGRLEALKVSVLQQQTPTAEQAQVSGAPRTATEGALLGIWMGILKRTDIGVHDNLFTLGGNSLQAAQLVAHVRDVFQVELPMQVFFEAPTIAGMAERIEHYRVNR